MTSTSRRASGLLLFVTLLIMFGLEASAFAQAADRAAAQAKARKIDELMTLYHSLGQFNGAVLSVATRTPCRRGTAPVRQTLPVAQLTTDH